MDVDAKYRGSISILVFTNLPQWRRQLEACQFVASQAAMSGTGDFFPLGIKNSQLPF
jgi:hypothetical protein